MQTYAWQKVGQRWPGNGYGWGGLDESWNTHIIEQGCLEFTTVVNIYNFVATWASLKQTLQRPYEVSLRIEWYSGKKIHEATQCYLIVGFGVEFQSISKPILLEYKITWSNKNNIRILSISNMTIPEICK